MKPLYIKAGYDTPLVSYNPNTNEFAITGRSLPENVQNFYSPIIEWVDTIEPSDRELLIRINLSYINSASAKLVIAMAEKLKNLFNDGVKMRMEWFYTRDEEDIMELGEDIKEFINFPMSIEEAPIK